LPLTTAAIGAEDLKDKVCVPFDTGNAWDLEGAGLNCKFPVWRNNKLHVPVPTKDTITPLTTQTVGASETMSTDNPEEAVATGVYVGPLTIALAGATLEIVIFCSI
jgi:hypothetical protein